MAETTFGKKAVSGMSWSFFIQGGHQVINLLVSIVLARVISPEEFGLVSMIMIFISISKVLVDGGFVSSLIRTKNVDNEDYSTVFFINLTMSVLLYSLLYFSAPYIALFYKQDILTSVIRVLGLVLIINAFTIVQSTKLNKALDFKTQFKLIIPSLLISAAISIYMAYSGYGLWSLVYKDLSMGVIAAALLWYHGKWKPSLVFNKQKLVYHFNFGYKLALTQIINTIFDNLYRLIIGKYISPAQLGYYARAKSLEQMPSEFFVSAFNRVAYPMLANVSDDQAKLKSVYSRLMVMAVFLISPVLIYLGVVAEVLFRWLYTAKWLPAVPYFQLLLISGLFYPIHKYNLNICNIKGRSDIVLKLSVLQNMLLAAGAFTFIWFGIYGLLISLVIINIIVTLINGYTSGTLINYGIKKQIADLSPVILIAAVAGAVTYMCNTYLLSNLIDFLRIMLSGILYALSYLALTMVFKKSIIQDVRKIIVSYKK